MKSFIAISNEGVIHTHAPSTDGNYATLCCLDGDDPAIEQFIVEVTAREASKISCPDCLKIFETARRLRATDFRKP